MVDTRGEWRLWVAVIEQALKDLAWYQGLNGRRYDDLTASQKKQLCDLASVDPMLFFQDGGGFDDICDGLNLCADTLRLSFRRRGYDV